MVTLLKIIKYMLNFDIIKSNLETLDSVLSVFPNLEEVVASNAFSNELRPYYGFKVWLDGHKKNGFEKVIYDEKLDFDFVKNTVLKYCKDIDVRKEIEGYTERKFNNFIKNQKKFEKYHGVNKPRQRKYYQDNFSKSDVIIYNWVVQNKLLERNISDRFHHYYTKLLPKFKREAILYMKENTDLFMERFREFLTNLECEVDLTNLDYPVLFKSIDNVFFESVEEKIKNTSLIRSIDASQTHQVKIATANKRTCSCCGSMYNIENYYEIDDTKLHVQSGFYKRAAIHRRDSLKKFLET